MSELVLSSGRVVYTNQGLIGINAAADELAEGYDGRIDVAPEYPHCDGDHSECWTAEEVEELRAIMIARWTKWNPTLCAAQGAGEATTE